jgi:hypothetical protein
VAELYAEAGDTWRALSVVRRRPFTWFNPVAQRDSVAREHGDLGRSRTP